MELPQWIYPIKRLIISQKIGQWCQLPYIGHPKGCPNYGEKMKCPPQAPMIEEFFDLSKSIYLVHSEFNLSDHIKKIGKRHPKWSERQCRCVLYWQPTSRKQLKQRINEAATLIGTNAISMTPEAMGVNIYATARWCGLKLDRIRSLSICRHVAMIGWGYKKKQQLNLW